MKINSAKRRNAISPVLATVILIAITLIAAIAIAGFVFGLFGSFTSTARVQIATATIVHSATTPGAGSSLLALNTGTSNTIANSVSLTFGGQTCGLTITGGTVTLTAGAAPGVPIPITAASGSCNTVASTTGEAFTGMLFLSNCGQVPFSGVFS